jgi:hypothetical protein
VLQSNILLCLEQDFKPKAPGHSYCDVTIDGVTVWGKHTLWVPLLRISSIVLCIDVSDATATCPNRVVGSLPTQLGNGASPSVGAITTSNTRYLLLTISMRWYRLLNNDISLCFSSVLHSLHLYKPVPLNIHVYPTILLERVPLPFVNSHTVVYCFLP